MVPTLQISSYLQFKSIDNVFLSQLSLIANDNH